MNSVNDSGHFIFSLDTELAWGSFDRDEYRLKHFSRDGSKERESILRLLDIFDEFNIVASWAVVGHMFYRECENCQICPLWSWKGIHRSFDEIFETNNRLWYGSDIIELLLSRGKSHEIAFHGYSHRPFDELSAEEAAIEIQEWLRVADRKSLIPKTVIFPQGRIGHLDLFRDAGFICYRGQELAHPARSWPVLGKALNRANLSFSLLAPQIYEASAVPGSLVNLPSSQWLFRVNPRIERFLDGLNLHNIRFQATANAIQRAGRYKKVIHLWAHPHEFRTEKDFEKLRYLLGYARREVQKGRLQSLTMADMATRVMENDGR